MRQSLFAKIFLWFCATIVVTLIVTLASAALVGSQPFGRRWMAMTQDLYAHSAVDFYQAGGDAALQRYLDTLARSSTVDGQLLDQSGRDVLGRATLIEGAQVLAQANQSGLSNMHLGRVWSAASPVSYEGRRYTFRMVVHPSRAIFDGTFARSMLPRVALGMALVAPLLPGPGPAHYPPDPGARAGSLRARCRFAHGAGIAPDRRTER